MIYALPLQMNIPTIRFVFFLQKYSAYLFNNGLLLCLLSSVTNATTVKSYVHHLHYRHGLTVTQKCKIGCVQLDCSQTFDSIQPQAVRIHLKQHHATDPYPTDSSPMSTLASADYCRIQSSDHEMESEANKSTAELGSVYEPVSIQAVHSAGNNFRFYSRLEV